MPEAMAGCFYLNKQWQNDFRTNAKELLGTRGMLTGGNTPDTDGLISDINFDYPYQYVTGGESWPLYPFWEYYEVSSDRNCLADQYYPLIRDMGDFYEDFLVKKDSNGRYLGRDADKIPVRPYREITPETNPAQFKAAQVFLQKKDAGNYENAGRGLLHGALIAADLNQPDSLGDDAPWYSPKAGFELPSPRPRAAVLEALTHAVRLHEALRTRLEPQDAGALTQILNASAASR